MNFKKSSQGVEAKALRRICRRGPGAVVTTPEFLDLGSRAAVDQAFARLVRRGTLRRVCRGVYSYPEQSRLLGELSPRPEAVARAVARSGGQRLLPSGAFAANFFGLSQQVPAKMEYLTDGPSRRIMIRNLPLILKQTSPRQLATSDRVSGTVAQALKFLRRPQVDEGVIEALRRRLTTEEKRELLQDIKLVPSWIGEVFRKVAGNAA